MARVRSTGGIATLQMIPVDFPAAESTISVNVRLYAKTATGLLAIDTRPQSYVAAIPREALRAGEPYAVYGLIQAPTFLGEGLPDGHTQGPWGGVLEELSRIFGIETDHETLQALPFELIGDRELIEALSTP